MWSSNVRTDLRADTSTVIDQLNSQAHGQPSPPGGSEELGPPAAPEGHKPSLKHHVFHQETQETFHQLDER